MNKAERTNLLTQLGFKLDMLQAIARNLTACHGTWWAGPPALADDVETWASDASREGMAAFAMASLGYEALPHPLDDRLEIARRLVAVAVYYLFGSWREKFRYLGEAFDCKKARAQLPWSDYFREGLAISLLLDDTSSFERLLTWPSLDLREDEGMDDRTPADNAYQIWLASRLRGESESSLGSQRESILQSPHNRPKMLLAAADALFAGNLDGLTVALHDYLRRYRQKEVRPNRVDLGICLDGTVLCHLARRRNLGWVHLPVELKLLIPSAED